MFSCPNCDEKIHWKKSLNLKPDTIMTCVFCGTKLSAVKRSYYNAAILALFVLFAFTSWVIITNQIMWVLMVIPFALLFVAMIFYYLVKFEQRVDADEKY